MFVQEQEPSLQLLLVELAHELQVDKTLIQQPPVLLGRASRR